MVVLLIFNDYLSVCIGYSEISVPPDRSVIVCIRRILCSLKTTQMNGQTVDCYACPPARRVSRYAPEATCTAIERAATAT